MNFKDEIVKSVGKLRDDGVIGELFVVPAEPSLRCLVPCEVGTCICIASVDKRYCVVNERGKKRAYEEANSNISFLNSYLRELDQ